jgi:hypothetical protein
MPTPAHWDVIDTALLLLHTKAFTLSLYLKMPQSSDELGPPQKQRERLRESMAGYHLRRIAEFAEGERSVTKDSAQESIRFIHKLLFEYPFADDPTPPASFHRTELGRMIGEAYLRLTLGTQLLTPTEAYRELHVSRQSVYDFVRDGKLNPLYLYGKMMLFAHEVETLKDKREKEKTRT